MSIDTHKKVEGEITRTLENIAKSMSSMAEVLGLQEKWEEAAALYEETLEVQWNLGIRDIQGTVKNCPEF